MIDFHLTSSSENPASFDKKMDPSLYGWGFHIYGFFVGFHRRSTFQLLLVFIYIVSILIRLLSRAQDFFQLRLVDITLVSILSQLLSRMQNDRAFSLHDFMFQPKSP
ncbi:MULTISPECIES: hypothetical protein [Geobacillus]|uniref:Uncharacterized protein n=2 Tax=Geobacillus thermoleovorans TaxID=33941 RepID=A0A2Z3N8Z9_GEOTH|nr:MULTISPECIES: hypothetical protein [Geobacillus]AWO75348.1 hypothetical protein C1N76_13095 [Geobacillus thermoleovorans]EQB96054.1 hypothetical protein GA8_08560 [Geobacillus sp. A8]KDE47500.1 hypothetical protein DI44_12715 [Geobacillus sp. CAMR5420]MBW7641832.1 hypothetical protein [Geobacillus thermoleovorans]MCG6793740.1 hypothetical protein [Geobacillus sp. YHL]